MGPSWPAVSKLLSSWFPDDKLNSVFGLINTASYTGGLGGTALATLLLQQGGRICLQVYLPNNLCIYSNYSKSYKHEKFYIQTQSHLFTLELNFL